MPKSIFRATVLCFAVCSMSRVLAEVPLEYLESANATAFGAPPTIGQPRLSPDGTQLIFLSQNPAGVSMLQSLNLADGSISTLLPYGLQGGHDIHWCNFASNTRILCDYRQGIPGHEIEYQKFVALNRDGSEKIELLRTEVCEAENALRGAILHMDFRRNTPTIDWLPDDPEAVLFICGDRATRVSLTDLGVIDVSAAGVSGDTQRLFSDGHGVPNLYLASSARSDSWYHRATTLDDWVEFHETDKLALEDPLQPVGYGTRTDRLFNIAWDEGNRTWGLFLKDLSGNYQNRLVFSHEMVDVELVDTLGPSERVVSAGYLEDRPLRAVIDPRVAEVLDYVAGLLPGIDIEVIDESWDQNIYLVRARAPGLAGEILAVNMDTGGVQPIGPEYVHLAGFELAETSLVQFEAADGEMVSAHLTMPVIETDGPIPAVIIPRARASHEDLEDPHYLVQFLAASGYAVLRVQNRGRDESGRGWIPLRAPVSWERSADDIDAGVRYLTEERGITTADSVCAAGKDYGAYTALMTVIRYPDLFGCIVSIGAISDTRLMPGAEAISNRASQLADELLDDASPVQRAAEVAPPVLMFHGRNDADVAMEENAVPLFLALRRADNDVRFIEYEHADHRFQRGLYRIDMLARTGEFLAEHIGVNPAYAAPIDPAIDE